MYKIKKIKLWTTFWISKWLHTQNVPILPWFCTILSQKTPICAPFHPLFALFASHSSISYLQVKTLRAIEWHTVQCIMDQNSIDQKKGICLNFHSKFAGIGHFECFENTLRSGMELVRNSAIYHSMGPLSSWPLLLTLISKKSGGRPTNRNAGAAGSTNENAPFSQQPSNRLAISWGAQQEGTGRDIALVCAKGSFRDRM